MNALEAIRKKESDHKAQIAALEAQIAEDSVTGNRNLPVLNQLDALKRTQPVTEDERLKAFQDHGLPVIKAYMEPFETALQQARAAHINAFAEYKAASVEANRSGRAWGRDFFQVQPYDHGNIVVSEEMIPEKTVENAPVCDDVQIAE